MPSGLVALLDDIAGITKLAAASLDDIGAAAAKAGAKAAGVVVDDAAVTPRYAAGFRPERELPIIGRIALGSLRNKLLILLPGALALSAFAPWAVTPLLMLGGVYLCYEGAEKVFELLAGHHEAAAGGAVDAKTLEDQKVGGAIRTDFILSAEIMAIALAEVAGDPLLTQAVVLALVGVAITAGVYGVVAVIVKMDDVGLHLAGRRAWVARGVGRGLLRGMPVLMQVLSAVGTAAMIWVGGGIVVHGFETYGMGAVAGWIHHVAEAAGRGVPFGAGGVVWGVTAGLNGGVGLVLGGVVLGVVMRVLGWWGRGVV